MFKRNAKIFFMVIAGCILLCCFTFGCNSSGDSATAEKIKNLEEKIAEVELQATEKIAEVELQATRAQDVLDILCLQARYEAIHSSQEELTWMLYAPREDSSDEVTHSRIIGYEYIKMQFTDRQKLMELYRAGKLPEGTHIYDFTAFMGTELGAAPAAAGPDASRGGMPGESAAGSAQIFGTGRPSIPPLHPVATPNIIVAADGKTAKATFTSLGYERGGWCYGKYANDYIKIDGKWYIWHKKWLRGFSTNYYKSPEEQTMEEIFEWVKDFDENGLPIIAKELTTAYLWYPGKESMTITAPQPYETWTEEDENGGWWKRETVTP